MKFYGRVLSSTSKNWLNFGGDLGIVRWVNEQKNTVIVVAYPDRGEGNDPEPFFFFFFFRGGCSLSQPRLNIFTVDNMGVMICLGQGGLHSLSASSFLHVFIFALKHILCYTRWKFVINFVQSMHNSYQVHIIVRVVVMVKLYNVSMKEKYFPLPK